MPKSNILITGASGLLGVPLTRHFIGRGFAVATQSRSLSTDVCCDLTDKSQTVEILDRIKPEFIVNLVALTNVDRCEEHPHQAYLQNVRTVETLAEWITGHPTCRLIHISTDQVYDSPGCKEEREITLRNMYAVTKYCSEIVASKVGATVLRTNFFGKSLAQNRKSLSDWVIENLRKGSDITLFSDIYFSPLSLSTLARNIEKVMELPSPGTYNLGSHGGMSKCDFALGIAKVLNLTTSHAKVAESTSLNLKAPRPKDMRMDCGLFERTFSVHLPSLDEEIATLRREYATSAG